MFMVNNNDKRYKLSEFAELMNVSIKTIQRWDKSGLIVADRNASNRRVYTQKHIDLHNEILSKNENILSRKKHFKYKDLTGLVFGELIVQHRVDDYIALNGHRHIQWFCECSCGGSVIVKGASLSAGYNKSCGCSQYGDNDTKRMWREIKQLKSDGYEPEKKDPVKVGAKRKDLRGQTFGWLTPLKHGPDKHHVDPNKRLKRTTWICRCICGEETVVETTYLTLMKTLSCGCMPNDVKKSYKGTKKSLSKPKKNTKRISLLGQTFGFWLVLEPAENKKFPSGAQYTRWLCRCKCGVEKIVPTRDLRSGSSQSCGCMTSMSWLEYYVQCYLIENNIAYRYQMVYPELIGTGGKMLSYDFLIFGDLGQPRMLIECQGEQHYRPIKRFGGAPKLIEQQIHDKLKRNFANDVLNIPLNEVLYTSIRQDDVYARMKSFGL